jgi:hypothetical protein
VGLVAALLCTMLPSPASAAQGDWKLGSPIFTPKSGSSFTTLFTNFQPFSRQMLLRRYDAVGTLLTSQAITIGANGSLQASPSAHSGAPLHVEIWTEHPGLRMLITYTDSSDVARRIEPGDMELVGPAYATAAGVSGELAEVNSNISALTSPIQTLQTGVSSVQTDLDAVATDVTAVKGVVAGTPAALTTIGDGLTGTHAKLDKIQSDLTATSTRLGQPVVTTPDPRIGRLQKNVAGLRKQVRGLRKLLKQALARRG